MPCPERAGGGDEKALKSRQQTGPKRAPERLWSQRVAAPPKPRPVTLQLLLVRPKSRGPIRERDEALEQQIATVGSTKGYQPLSGRSFSPYLPPCWRKRMGSANPILETSIGGTRMHYTLRQLITRRFPLLNFAAAMIHGRSAQFACLFTIPT